MNVIFACTKLDVASFVHDVVTISFARRNVNSQALPKHDSAGRGRNRVSLEVKMSVPPDTKGSEIGVRLPHRSVLADEIYDIVRDDLVSHRIPPGQQINLDRLAKRLHVSNTPVRQALARLESEGMVTKEPHRGFAASQLLDSRAIAELYDYRLLIEPALCARIVQRRSEASAAAELEALSDPAEIARLVASDRPEELHQRDNDFHSCIARFAGNSVIIGHLAQTLTRMRLYSAYHRHGASEAAWREHRGISAAIRAGDPESAANAMRDHLKAAIERLRDAVQ